MSRRKLKRYEVRLWMKVRDAASIRRWRKRRGFTQRELAFLVQKTQTTIHLLETGQMRTLTDDLANAIARRLDVDVEELFEVQREISVPSLSNAARTTGGDAA